MAAKKREVWNTPSPNKESKPLSPSQKRSAMESARKAGRPYPNMIDNINAAKKKK